MIVAAWLTFCVCLFNEIYLISFIGANAHRYVPPHMRDQPNLEGAVIDHSVPPPQPGLVPGPMPGNIDTTASILLYSYYWALACLPLIMFTVRDHARFSL